MKPVFQWVDNDEDVAKLGGKDASTIVTPVLAPNDMYLVVANMSRLLQQRLVCRGRHSGGDVEYGLDEGGGEVGSGLARQRSSVDCPLEATQKTGMCLELNLHDKQEGNPHSDRPPKVIQGQKPLLTSTVTVLV